MGQIIEFATKKLIIGVIINPEKLDIVEVKERLIKEYGPIDFASEPIPFLFTTYYQKEMGDNLIRYFFSFRYLVNPERLSEIKIKTNTIEEECAALPGERPVNLDPGLLSLGKLVLASTKNYSHRIPLQKGIYGEITLTYAHKDWQSLPWTYPDYATREYKEILSRIRSLFWQQKQKEEVR